jgi:hypothetical protein
MTKVLSLVALALASIGLAVVDEPFLMVLKHLSWSQQLPIKKNNVQTSLRDNRSKKMQEAQG